MNIVLKSVLALLLSAALLAACSEGDDGPTIRGTAAIEITDAPIDDANIEGAFITVAEVKVDGEAISNFSGRQTIDIMAFQNGNTKALGLAELETGAYSSISLVLDYEQDASGSAPGCYILTNDGTRHSLGNHTNASNEIVISNKEFTVEEDAPTTIVVDFDLRKAITYDSQGDANDRYEFVSQSEMSSSLRLAVEAETGQISGKCQDNFNLADRIVVYAYAKGTYNKEAEIAGQGQSNITFKNAVTSAVVNTQGNYTLAFLPEGDYELHFFAYDKNENEGVFELKGELAVDLLTALNLDLNQLQIEANSNVSVDVSVVAVIP